MKKYIKKALKKRIMELNANPIQDKHLNPYDNIVNVEVYGDLLTRLSQNPNYVFILGDKMIYSDEGLPHHCDTNTYNYIKEKLNEGKTNYYPVGGYWFFHKGDYRFEHRWIYDKNKNIFIETTPILGEKPTCYAGIINFEINDEIKNSNDISEVKWFRNSTLNT
jgi:hypothetical protein